jgi:hypothetical protein
LLHCPQALGSNLAGSRLPASRQAKYPVSCIKDVPAQGLMRLSIPNSVFSLHIHASIEARPLNMANSPKIIEIN